MVLVFFGAAIVILLITILLTVKERLNGQRIIKILLAGCSLMVGVLIFPAYCLGYGEAGRGDVWSSGIFSVLYALRTLAGRQPLGITVDYVQDYMYVKWLLYVLFIAGPTITAGFIISFFGSFVENVRFHMMRKAEVHVFSQLNEAALLLAESIHDNNCGYVFCNYGEKISDLDEKIRKRIKQIRGVVLKSTEAELKFSADVQKIHVYEIAENKAVNEKNALAFMERYKKDLQEKSVEVAVFASGPTTEIMFNSVEKKNCRIRIIDEVKYTCYSLLFDSPLYQKTNHKKVSVVIVGAGTTGKEMIKAVSWCGQMIDTSLEISVIDQDTERAKMQLLKECPELFMENKINFYQADVTRNEFKKVLDQYCRDATYIVIALKEDDLNIDTATYLKMYYEAVDFSRKELPVIHLRVRDTVKNERIMGVYHKDTFHMNAFGSIEKVFSHKNLIHSNLEKMALASHFAYCEVLDDLEHRDDPKKMERVQNARDSYNSQEYNQRSSFASVLHIIYKMHDCGVTVSSGSLLERDHIEQLRENLKDSNLRDRLAQLEHRRWNAFMRSEGYSKASIDAVEQYFEYTQKPINKAAKLHPALVSWEELDFVSHEISRIEKKVEDYKAVDYFFIDRMCEILEAAMEE